MEKRESMALRSSFSTREPRLLTGKKESSSRMLVSGLDFGLSKFLYNKARKDSISVSGSNNILPSLTESGKQRLGKTVVFKIDHYPILSKTLSSSLKEEMTKRYFQPQVTEDGVKYSLDHKEELLQEFSSFLQCEEAVDTGVSQSSLDSEETDEAEIPEKKKEEGIVFQGVLTASGPSENSVHVIKTGISPTSKNVSVGSNTPGQVTLRDIWPWAWLDPESSAKNLYKSSIYSKITFSNQSKIKSVPLPVLAHSLNWYLQSVKPCVSATTFAVTKKLVNEFASGEGKVYHERLINFSESPKTTWIKEFLPNYNYCYSRQEAPILNLGIVAPFMYDLWPEREDTQLNRATVLVSLTVEFWQLIREEKLLPISITKDGQTACMHEFRKLFSSVKLPGIPRDEIYYCFKTLSEDANEDTPRHIVVLYKGQIFSMEVINKSSICVSSDDIRHRLWSIINSVDEGAVEMGVGIGVLTSMDRSVWSEVRLQLIKYSDNNQACLNEIERAMFVLSLDHMRIANLDRLPHEAVFADGCNRWYDKSLSFYVYKNGLVTVNVNSSILEGSTVAFLLHYIHLRIMEDAEKWDDDVLKSISRHSVEPSVVSSRMEELMFKISSRISLMSDMNLVNEKLNRYSNERSSDDMSASFEPKALIFDLDESLETVIEDAKITFLEISASLHTAVCKFEGYDRTLFTMKGVNTDAFAHLVIQLTFFRMYFRPASIGSKASLRRFHYGRYEVFRATTSEAVNWCKIMLDPDSDFEDQSYNFWKAERKHVSLLQKAFSGNGSENHLAALRVIAEDQFSVTPKLFEDESFRIAGGCGRFDINTECLAVACTSCAVVWPSVPAGYGVGYFVASTKIVFTVSSLSDDRATSAQLFACSLDHTLRELHDFLRRL